MASFDVCDMKLGRAKNEGWFGRPSARVHWGAKRPNKMLLDIWQMPDFRLTVHTVAEATLEERFQGHADKWEHETCHLSSTTRRVLHPSYQAIIGMGRDVVPLLLRDLQQNRRAWFWALSCITEANPISSTDAGNVEKMIAAWLKWGREKGVL